VTKHCYTYCFP